MGDEKHSNDEEFGWTTVQQNKAKKTVTTTSNPTSSSSVPGTPSKSENSNAWTNRALKQLLDMGFKREHAEKALRDNNGIIESAVSDLLMKGDMAEPTPATTQQSAPKPETIGTPQCNGTPSQITTTPQKLNRKQRRKLQQMQNAEQQKETPIVAKDSAPSPSSVSESNNSHN